MEDIPWGKVVPSGYSHTAARLVGAEEAKGPHWGAVLGMGSSLPSSIEHWYALGVGRWSPS